MHLTMPMSGDNAATRHGISVPEIKEKTEMLLLPTN